MSAPHHEARFPQEEDKVSPLSVMMAAVIVVVTFTVMVVWAWATTVQVMTSLRPSRDYPEERLRPSASPRQANQPLFFGEPGLGERLNAEQERELTQYRWLDRSRGIVTLPIEQAMDRIAGESAR